MEKILVLDFGGQYNQLIARRVRDHHIYAEILPYTTPLSVIRENGYKGIIFTGGPNSVYDETSPHYEKGILELGVPVLGICYGCQLMAYLSGGTVSTAPVSEYGKIELTVSKADSPLFSDVPKTSTVWMSHTDYISAAPEGFEVVAKTENCPCAAMQNPEKKLYAVQFHPEVTHSVYGDKMLENFLYKVCGCKGDWKMDSFIDDTVKALREQIGDKHVILGLSGGVDSSVAAGLLSRAVGKQLICVFVDQGLMRKNEGDFVEETFTKLFDMQFVRVNCGDVFLSKLKGVTDPEEKRHIIGDAFYEVFWDEIKKRAHGDAFFAQGTIYPDRIESGKGASGKGAGGGHAEPEVTGGCRKRFFQNRKRIPEFAKPDQCFGAGGCDRRVLGRPGCGQGKVLFRRFEFLPAQMKEPERSCRGNVFGFFGERGPQSVYIPRIQFHVNSL